MSVPSTEYTILCCKLPVYKRHCFCNCDCCIVIVEVVGELKSRAEIEIELLSLNGDGDGEQAHVVLVPSPLKGHSIPFMILTEQLLGYGVQVTYMSSDKHIASLEKAKGKAKGSHKNGQAGMDELRFVGLQGGPANFFEAIEEHNDENMAKQFCEWMAMAMARPVKKPKNGYTNGRGVRAAPCCIISDMFGGWAHTVAQKFAIPSHVLFTSPAACAAMQLQIPRFIVEGVIPQPSSCRKGPVSIPGVPPLDPHDLPGDLIAEVSSLNYKFYTRNTLQLSELMKFVPIGPLLQVECGTRAEDRHPAEKWLDTQEDASVIYVAFGTGIFFPPEQVVELAQGLEASGQPFFLVLQLSDLPDRNALDYFPTGVELDPKSNNVQVLKSAQEIVELLRQTGHLKSASLLDTVDCK